MNQESNEAKNKQHPMAIIKWPKRDRQGLGISFLDGWNFGTGFGLALLIAVPLLMLAIGCGLWLILLIFGSALQGFF